MKISVSSDEHGPLVDFVLQELKKRGYPTNYFGPGPGEEAGDDADWPLVTRKAAESVTSGDADEAIVICWTGTGACLAANKVKGIRAALCNDAETARGARTWNHANTLALSMRATTPAVAAEILEAWFSTPPGEDDWNKKQILRIRDMEAQ